MSDDVWRRCGCRDQDGRQFRPLPKNPTTDQQNRACPAMLTDPKHGTWGYTVYAGTDAATRKRRQIRKAGFTGVRAAERARAKLVTSLDDGTYREASNVTVGAYCIAWLPRRKATGNGLRPSTARMYGAYIDKDIAPSKLGTTRLQDVRRSNVAEFVQGLVDSGRGARTIKRIIATLQAALAQAVKDELIVANPAADTDLPTVRRKEVHPWEPDQQQKFLTEASHHRLGALYEVTILTGLRRGEVCGLRWADVDLEHPTPRRPPAADPCHWPTMPLLPYSAGVSSSRPRQPSGTTHGATPATCSPWRTATRCTRPTSPACSRRSARGPACPRAPRSTTYATRPPATCSPPASTLPWCP